MKQLHKKTQQLTVADQPKLADMARSSLEAAESDLARPALSATAPPAQPGGPASPSFANQPRSNPPQAAQPQPGQPVQNPQRSMPMGGGFGGGEGGGIDGESAGVGMMGFTGEDRSRIAIAEIGPKLAAADKSPKTKAILKKLDEPLEMSFADETPLEDVLKYIKAGTSGQNGTGIPIYVDIAGLQEAEKTLSSPVQIDLSGVPLKTSLRLLLKQLGLAYHVRDGVLIISSTDGIFQELKEALRDCPAEVTEAIDMRALFGRPVPPAGMSPNPGGMR
jgi:hypothetical protein